MPDNTDFERQLAQRLRAYESSIPDEEAPMQRRQSATRTRWMLGAGVVAAGTLAGILLAVVLLNRPDAQVGEPSATPSPTSTPVGPDDREGWTAVGIGESGDSVAVNGVAEWEDGLMAFGRSATEAGAIWLSTDGQSWTPAEVPDSPPGTAVFVNGIVRSGDRYVAVGTLGHPEGSGPMGSVIWLSPDGRTWTESEGSPTVRNVPLSGLASMGNTIVTDGLASIWRSDDAGTSWVEVTPPDAEGWNFRRVAVLDGRFVAPGFIGSPLEPQEAAVWTSVDGASWTRTVLDGELATSVAPLPDGRLLMVGEAEGAVRAWISSDGDAWEPMTVEADCCIVNLAATPTGVVGVGFGPTPGGVTLATTDAETWSSQTDVLGALYGVIYTERFGIVAGGADADNDAAVIFGPHPHP